MNLLLLTKFYPYGTGEAFIENEIEIAAKFYDEIIIIACEATETNTNVRKLPRNVTSYGIAPSSKIEDMIVGVIKHNKFCTAFKDEIHSCGDLPQKAFLTYFEEKSNRIFSTINAKVDLKEFTQVPYLIYSYWFFTTARVGMLISEEYSPKAMFTRAHRYDLYEKQNKLNYLPYRKLFLSKYNFVFPCSENGTRYLKERYPFQSANVLTSFLGTLDHGRGVSSSDGILRIVSCSRVEPVKRVGLIVDALKELESTDLKIEWTHIGDGSELDKLKNYVNHNLKRVRVVFRGNMKNADIMKLYATAPFDVFVNVSSSEGLPVSIMEALSFGLPCIATDVGGTSEIVIDNITGKLIPGNFTPEMLANCIKEIAASDDKEVIRNNCRQYWETNFRAIPNYRKLHTFIRDYAK